MKGFSIIALLMVMAVIFCSMPSVASAEREMTSYVAVKPGVFFPLSELDDKGFDTSFAGLVTVGTYQSPNLALETSLGYISTRAEKKMSTGWEDLDLWVVPLQVTIKAVLPIRPLELSVGAGGGLYFTTARARGYENEAGDYSHRDHDIAYGGHLDAGATFDLGGRMFLGVEGQYHMTTSAKIYGSKVRLNGITATSVVGFRF